MTRRKQGRCTTTVTNIRRPGASFGKNNPFVEPRAPEVFDYKKALRETRGSLKQLKQKNDFVFARLEHALELVRKQRRRYAEIVEGKASLGTMDEYAIRYQFVCVTCEKRFDTFYKLRDHKHTTKYQEASQPMKNAWVGNLSTYTPKSLVLDDCADLEELDNISDTDSEEFAI